MSALPSKKLSLKKINPQKTSKNALFFNKDKVEGDKKNKYKYVGRITHYFDKISVSVVQLDHNLIKLNDNLLIKGKQREIIQKVHSMQIESVDVKIAKKGQIIGLKVDKPVKEGDLVYKLNFGNPRT